VDKRLNIGIFTNAYHPITSGVVKAIDFMKKGLSELGHAVYIIAPHYPDWKEKEPNVFRYPSIQLLPHVDFPLAIPYAPKLKRLIENLPLDIVHVQHPFLLGVLGAKVASKKKIPLVFTFHTRYEDYAHYAFFGISSKIAKKIIQKSVSSFLKKCDAIVAPSPFLLSFAKNYASLEKWVVIPNAIDPLQFQKGDKETVKKMFALHGKKISLFVGRLAQEKNLLFLLRAFKNVSQHLENVVLLLVGDGPYRATLENYVKQHGLTSTVIFVGLVPYEKIQDYLASAHLFITASTSEVNPLSILEAMSAGLPVLAVKAPWVEGVLSHEKDSVLVEEKEEFFSSAWIRLLQDEKMLEILGEEARKKGEGFGYKAMAQKLEALYFRLIHKA
jgi:1,2-diacylglycerol 3-alpha-glucosyltransferase